MVVKQRLGLSYPLSGLCYLLHRLGWSRQAPARRAAGRDEMVIAAWLDFHPTPTSAVKAL